MGSLQVGVSLSAQLEQATVDINPMSSMVLARSRRRRQLDRGGVARAALHGLQRWLVVFALMGSTVSRAEGVVVESYTGSRPNNASEVLAPLHDELTFRGYTSGEAAGRAYASRVSRVATAPLPAFEDTVERGHKAWIAGRFDEAIDVLTPVIAAAHASSAVVAQNKAYRDRLFKAVVALALSHQRRGDLAEAKAMLTELVRSFPDAQIARGTYGPEAYQFFESVRRELSREGRARLAIKVPESGVVFINERFENVGSVNKADLIPGPYRVFAQQAKQTSRVHTIDVKADDERSLVIDMAYDTSLHTSPWTGFEFATADQRERFEARYAARFASEIGADAVIVVGIDVVHGRPAVVGSLIDMQTNREIRRASLALEPMPSEGRLRALARFLGGEEAAPGLDVEIGETDAPTERAGGANRDWMLWSGIGAIVVGAAVGGGLGLKFHFDARAAADELDRACMTTCTLEQVRSLQDQQDTANRNALIAGISGGVIAATGIVFVVVSRMSHDAPAGRGIAAVPLRHGVFASFTTTF